MNERFKIVRDSLRLSQKEFADRIGFAQTSYSQIENGVRNVTERIIKLVCQEFNVNEEWLRTGTGEIFKTEGEFIELIASSLDVLDETDKKIISEYIKLSSNHREIIKGFIKKMTI
jgi:transcriptional regulator with XRE-family HTH domain